MSATTDRKILAREMNRIVFVFLIVILSAVNFVFLLLPIEDDVKGVIMVTGAFINIIFWVDSFYWLNQLPGRRYLADLLRPVGLYRQPAVFATTTFAAKHFVL